MGLFEVPADGVPEGGFRFRRFVCEDAPGPLTVFVDERFLTPTYVTRHNLVFNLEGYGRFRLWFDPDGAPGV